jgi:hypothetical protein
MALVLIRRHSVSGSDVTETFRYCDDGTYRMFVLLKNVPRCGSSLARRPVYLST